MGLQSNPPIAAGILLLVSEICKHRPTLVSMITASADELALEAAAGGSAVDAASTAEDDESALGESNHVFGGFDAAKREPLYGSAYTPALWETSLFQRHFHPSVQAFAASLQNPPHSIAFAGDPTVEFSTVSFLNRFAYKNPKKLLNDKVRRAQATPEEPVNLLANLDAQSADIAPDKQFFYKFFGEREKLREDGKNLFTY